MHFLYNLLKSLFRKTPGHVTSQQSHNVWKCKRSVFLAGIPSFFLTYVVFYVEGNFVFNAILAYCANIGE